MGEDKISFLLNKIWNKIYFPLESDLANLFPNHCLIFQPASLYIEQQRKSKKLILGTYKLQWQKCKHCLQSKFHDEILDDIRALPPSLWLQKWHCRIFDILKQNYSHTINKLQRSWGSDYRCDCGMCVCKAMIKNSIATRNGKVVWKHGKDLLFYSLVLEPS